MRMATKHFYIFFIGALVAIIFSNAAMAGDKDSDVTVKKASEMIKQASEKTPIAILDVRTKGEFDSGHLNNAINIDVKSSSFKEKISKLNKDETYLVYCRSGKRSKMAQNIMKELRFKKAINMLGGFMAWEKAGLPFSK